MLHILWGMYFDYCVELPPILVLGFCGSSYPGISFQYNAIFKRGKAFAE